MEPPQENGDRTVHLSRYVKPYWKFAVAAPLLMLIEVACDLLQPSLMARIIDEGVANGDLPVILRIGGFMLLAALLGIVGGAGCTVFSTLTSQHFGADLRQDLYRKVESFSFHNMDKFSTASLITRLTNDVQQLQQIVMMLLRMLVRAPILCVGGIAMAVSISPSLALISLSVLPFLAILLAFVITRGFPLFGLVQEKLDKLNLVIRENLTAIRVVKAFVRSGYEQKRFGTANQALADNTIRATRVVGTSMPLMMLIVNAGILLALWFGGYRVQEGTLRVGQIMALLNYITQILHALTMSAMMLMNFSRAKVSADRVREVLAEMPDIEDGTALQEPMVMKGPGENELAENGLMVNVPVVNGLMENGPMDKGRITFRHVGFQYAGASGDQVLIDIHFTVDPGQTVAILGATGVGKSTLVNLIPRFYDATAGEVLVHGRDVRTFALDELRGSIGVVLQEAILFSGTIRDNIRWGKQDATDDQVMEAAKAAQAHEFVMGFPDGYDTVVGQRGVNLSGGQKQRLSIARALLRTPDILILDDSTSAVDLATEARFRKALSGLMGKTTVLLIAQRINSVMSADRIVVLDKGSVSGIGTHEELMASNPVYQEIYHSQVGEADLDMPEGMEEVSSVVSDGAILEKPNSSVARKEVAVHV